MRLQNCQGLRQDFAASLALATSLQTLDLSGCRQITNGALEHLRDVVSLTELDLRACRLINDDGIAALSNLGQLNALNLVTRSTMPSPSSPSSLSGLSLLTHTRICANAQSNCPAITARTLRTLSNFPRLRTLSLSCCAAITQDDLRELSALGSLQVRRVLCYVCFLLVAVGLATPDHACRSVRSCRCPAALSPTAHWRFWPAR